MTVVAVDTVLWVGLVVVLAVVALLLLMIAPWKSVREEPPLDSDIETRLLLGEDPAKIAADADAEEARRNRGVGPDGGLPEGALGDADPSDLSDADRPDGD